MRNCALLRVRALNTDAHAMHESLNNCMSNLTCRFGFTLDPGGTMTSAQKCAAHVGTLPLIVQLINAPVLGTATCGGKNTSI